MHSALYIILALLGLTFLVFIHEFGHYLVARRHKMKVETFSIGFGKPLISWKWKGVKWQICLILVGGYVKIAGMEKEGNKEPQEIPDGFYSKTPWARIQVALAGPLVNLLFALIAFTTIWGLGGRQKPFSHFTRLIGAMDPQSELYANGVRPGDEITVYNKEKFEGYKDLIYAALVNGRPATVEGNKINYFKETQTPYDYLLTPYDSPLIKKGLKTIGVLSPASYLIYARETQWQKEPIFRHSPLSSSGIKPGDRLVWVDGELIFSSEQLTQILNSNKALLTLQRGGKTWLARVPRLPLTDLQLTEEESTEIEDWKYELGLHTKEAITTFIPYMISDTLTVEKGVFFLNKDARMAHAMGMSTTSPLDSPLEEGDRIIAVEGFPVSSPQDLLKALQTKQTQIIVKRAEQTEPILWEREDAEFKNETNWQDLVPLIASIGLPSPLRENGHFHLLNPVTPLSLKSFPFPEEIKSEIEDRIRQQLVQVSKIADANIREEQIKKIEKYQNQLMLGADFRDRSVIYNPNPFALYKDVFREITRNFTALFSGYFSPKYLGGPVFIVQVMKESWGIGFREALFWLGAISLNLGILNLLPIPVLDGGHICISLIEKIRKKPLKRKVINWLTIPFVILLILAFVYLTFNDLARLIENFL